MSTRLRNEALLAADIGLPVFPCDPDTKRPLVQSATPGAGGVKLATTDPGQIERWWSRWPAAAIGMRCGSKEDSGAGVIVIDLDVNGGSISDLLERLRLRLAELAGADPDHYVIPPCPVAETPRGGLHFWFGYPPGGLSLGNRTNVLSGDLQKIDIRANGGYAIIPPSVRTGPRAVAEGCEGKAYTWRHGGTLDDVPQLVPAPPEVIRLVTEKLPSRGEIRPGSDHPAALPLPRPTPTGFDLRERAIEKFVAAAVEGEMRRVAGARKGERNHVLNNAAVSLGHHVATGRLLAARVQALLLDAARQNGMIGDDGQAAALATIESGLRFGASEPANYERVGRLARTMSRRALPSDSSPDIEAGSVNAPRPGKRASTKAAPDTDIREQEMGSGVVRGRPKSGDRDSGPLDVERLRVCFEQDQNDTGNAKRLLCWFGSEFCNVDTAENPALGAGVHVWTGTHWDQTTGYRTLQKFAQRTAERIGCEAVCFEMTEPEAAAIEAWRTLKSEKHRRDFTSADKDIEAKGKTTQAAFDARRTARERFGIASGNGSRLGHMIAQALPHCTVPPEAMDADPNLINVRNGTLRGFFEHDPGCPDENCNGACGRRRPAIVLEPHRREDKITKCMPVTYDPNATAPKFLAFAKRCHPNPENLGFLQRWFGLSLTGLTEQSFVLNYGTGANGKTTFIETIATLMGEYAQTLPAEALVGDQQRRGDQATPELARLRGARMVHTAELPRGQNLRESTIKLLTGGDRMPVRQLHGKFWDLTPTFKAVGSCNEKPDIIGIDEGIWRRVKLVPWKEMIPFHERRKSRDVLAEFEAERSGILNWLIQGLLDYLTSGLAVPPEVQAATETYRDEMDPVGSFFAACVTRLPEGSRKRVGARQMYEAYQAYCHENSIRVFTQKNFAGILAQKGVERTRSNGIKYLDVELHDVPADPHKSHASNGPSNSNTVYAERPGSP